MSAPASSELRELARELLLAAERGETLSIGQMREFTGAGHDDLMGMLDALREHGQAVEDAPGDWRGPLQDELDAVAAVESAPAPLRVSVPEREEAAAERPRFDAPRAGVGVASGEPTVRLTRSIAEALDAAALGQVVQAALLGLADGELFVLEVTP